MSLQIITKNEAQCSMNAWLIHVLFVTVANEFRKTKTSFSLLRKWKKSTVQAELFGIWTDSQRVWAGWRRCSSRAGPSGCMEQMPFLQSCLDKSARTNIKKAIPKTGRKLCCSNRIQEVAQRQLRHFL